jgi:hypothetical protein
VFEHEDGVFEDLGDYFVEFGACDRIYVVNVGRVEFNLSVF